MQNKQHTILIVDDEDQVRDVYERAFERAGYIVRSAESEEKALEALKGEDISVMFLDLKLNGMTGIDVCRKIRNQYPDAIIYAITAYASEFELADCCEAGFNGYFLKPVKLEDLHTAASQAFAALEENSVSV